MFKLYKKWIDKKEAKEQQRKFKAGFDWAMSDFYIEKKSIEEIKAHIYTAESFGDYDQFDEGARRALAIIELTKRLEAEKQYHMTQKQIQSTFEMWLKREKNGTIPKGHRSHSDYFIMVFEELNEGPGNE